MSGTFLRGCFVVLGAHRFNRVRIVFWFFLGYTGEVT